DRGDLDIGMVREQAKDLAARIAGGAGDGDRIRHDFYLIARWAVDRDGGPLTRRGLRARWPTTRRDSAVATAQEQTRHAARVAPGSHRIRGERGGSPMTGDQMICSPLLFASRASLTNARIRTARVPATITGQISTYSVNAR